MFGRYGARLARTAHILGCREIDFDELVRGLRMAVAAAGRGAGDREQRPDCVGARGNFLQFFSKYTSAKNLLGSRFAIKSLWEGFDLGSMETETARCKPH